LKTRLGVVQGHLKWHRSIDHMRLSIGRPLRIQLYLVPFSSYLTLNNIVTLKSGLEVTLCVIEAGAIQKLRYGFLFAFNSNYGAILYRL